MIKYIFHMANNTKQEVLAEDLGEALRKLAWDDGKPIGTNDGKANSILHIEVDTKWTPPNEPEK